MQKWEYKTIVRYRGWEKDKNNKDAPWRVAGDWDVDIDVVKLGDEGWELMAVVPRSGVLGDYERGEYRRVASYADYAGFTSEELWVFKRTKQ